MINTSQGTININSTQDNLCISKMLSKQFPCLPVSASNELKYQVEIDIQLKTTEAKFWHNSKPFETDQLQATVSVNTYLTYQRVQARFILYLSKIYLKLVQALLGLFKTYLGFTKKV